MQHEWIRVGAELDHEEQDAVDHQPEIEWTASPIGIMPLALFLRGDEVIESGGQMSAHGRSR